LFFGIKVLGIGYQLQNVMFLGALNFISHVYKYNLNHYMTYKIIMNVRTQCYINVDIWLAVLIVKGFKYVLFVELL